jgi:hypothetical protein
VTCKSRNSGGVVGPYLTIPCTNVPLHLFKDTHLLTGHPNTRDRSVTVSAMVILQIFEVKARTRFGP